MNAFVPVIGVLFAAAITPGPNNMIVMEAGTRGGMAAAIAPMLGVIGGSLLLLALVWLGVAGAMQTFPVIELILSVCGGAYLAWLGIGLMRGPEPRAGSDPRAGLPSTLAGVALFQLLNPKSWVLVATAAAAMPRGGSLAVLALLTTLITGACLTLWGFAGAATSRLLAKQRARRYFDTSMGALLTISAAAIVAEALLS